jgi:hypothetical protein
MKKRSVIGVLALSLVAILFFHNSGAVAQDTEQDRNSRRHSIDCEGMPPYTPGVDVGIFISCNVEGTEWSVRWSGDRNRETQLKERAYLFTGDIRAREISNVVEVDFEEGVWYDDSSNLRSGSSHDILSFNAGVGSEEDGLDFAVNGNSMKFSFDGNLKQGPGSYTLTASDIYIGADGLHPLRANFSIRTYR